MRDWKDYLRTQEIKVVKIETIKPFENNPRLNKAAEQRFSRLREQDERAE